MTRYQGQHVGLEIVIRFGSKYTYNSSPVLRLLTSFMKEALSMRRVMTHECKSVFESELSVTLLEFRVLRRNVSSRVKSKE